MLDVKITLLQNAKPLTHNSGIRFHHLTHDVLARVTLMGTDALAPAESCFAQLRLQRKIVAVYSDRFIRRKHSPLHTIGGGVILDHLLLKRASQKDSAALERMRHLEWATVSQRLAMAVLQKGISGATEQYQKAKLALMAEEILAVNSDDVLILQQDPVLVISREAERSVLQKMEEAVSAFH